MKLDQNRKISHTIAHMNTKNVAVVYGGISNEREVSLVSGRMVAEAIPTGAYASKYTVHTYDLASDLVVLLDDLVHKKIDVVFPVLHGRMGEDGTIQGLCETLRVPYVGSGIETSAICMNKETAKRLAMTQGMLTPEFELLEEGEQVDLRNIELPCVIKPGNAGSSVGVTIPESFEELKVGITTAFKQSRSIIIEKFISGREFTVSMIGTPDNITVFPPTEIIPNDSKFYDYSAKYDAGGSTHVCPAELSNDHRSTLENLGRRAFKLFNAHGMLRVDFMFDEKDELFYFIEANTIPGMTSTSLLPEAAKAAGVDFPALLDQLLTLGLERTLLSA